MASIPSEVSTQYDVRMYSDSKINLRGSPNGSNQKIKNRDSHLNGSHLQANRVFSQTEPPPMEDLLSQAITVQEITIKG